MAGIDINTITNAIPKDRQIKGLPKLGQLLIQKATELESQIIGPLSTLKAGLTEGVCPDPAILDAIITKRNNIVNKLNSAGRLIDTVNKAFIGVSTFLEILIFGVTALKATKTGASLAVKFLPVSPGAVTSVLSDLEDVKNKITYDNLGNSKLQKYKDSIDSLIIPIALFSVTIKTISALLNSLDALITPCLNANQQLNQVSAELQAIINSELEADKNDDDSYKGFVFQIEEVPYTPTVNRRKAIAVNKQGIPLLETALSFTTNNQTLIDELKLIIDRDNLKAY
jgi:hypothetical protein